jgi:uncharacterized protein
VPGPGALFDTNLYLNYLISPDPTGTAVDLALEAGAEGVFQLLLPDDVVAELAAVILRRPYLATRIGQTELEALLRWVLVFATPVPPFEDEPPPVCRDPRDDYLIALAVIHAAHYIVTRDRDLLTLSEVAGVQIVDPVAFLRVLLSSRD